MKPAICVLCSLVVLAGAVSAQNVISAKAGLVNYTEGKVLLDGKKTEFERHVLE